MKKSWSAADIRAELYRISTDPYRPRDHERNHQTFAKALLIILHHL